MTTNSDILKQIHKRVSPTFARCHGYIIDQTVYPWVAYKGPRYEPTSWHPCLTDIEEALWSERNERLTINLCG